jgi:uncharacterized protein (TIGR02145 family)
MEQDSFPSVKIGSQIWTKENLQVSKFCNGEPIPLVQDDEEWSELETAAYCIGPEGHYFYNWFAVIDPRGLAPEGWHVPSDEEWNILEQSLGLSSVDAKQWYYRGVHGSAMKSEAWDGTNESGFSALPAGYRFYDGFFFDLGDFGYWWSSSPDGGNAIYRFLTSGNSNVNRYYSNPHFGFSVRCVRD